VKSEVPSSKVGVRATQLNRQAQRVQSVNVSLVRALKSDECTLKNLLHLYIHDFSEFLGLTPSEDGSFSYPALPLYWSESDRTAYFIRTGAGLVGFALVSRGSMVSGDRTVFDLAEFFVVRGVRRRGVGQAAAHNLFRSMPGKWEVRVAEFNIPAQQFWKRVIEKCCASPYKIEAWTREDGSKWSVMCFTSSGAIGGALHGA
jgi:predicted acetyltransferase